MILVHRSSLNDRQTQRKQIAFLEGFDLSLSGALIKQKQDHMLGVCNMTVVLTTIGMSILVLM